MKIQVYGKGCRKCERLTANVYKALSELGCEGVEVEHVRDLEAIAALGPVMTPVLVVDGKILSQGLAMSPRRVRELLRPLVEGRQQQRASGS